MILTDREIEIALANGNIVVDPLPDLKKALSSTTLDLRLSDIFEEWEPLRATTIHPGADDFSHRQLERLRKRTTGASFHLNPGGFVLGWTIETVGLPIASRIAARVDGKSSLARLGIGVHVTAPVIHSGFSGNIQLEIFNLGPHHIVLDAEMRICQLVFEQTYGTPLKGYSGVFAGQRAATRDSQSLARS